MRWMRSYFEDLAEVLRDDLFPDLQPFASWALRIIIASFLSAYVGLIVYVILSQIEAVP